jgi:hypothetical protein
VTPLDVRDIEDGHRAGDVTWTWFRVSEWFRWYIKCGSLSASFRYFRYREGQWVVARFIILCLCTYVAALGDWLHGVVAALYLGADVLLLNTAIVFVTGQPLNVLRSVVLTMVVGYPSLALAFAPLWLVVTRCDGPELGPWSPLDHGVTAFHRSLGALTSGTAENAIAPVWTRTLGIIEHVVGLCYLVVIVAGYVSWMKGDRR